MYAVFQYGMQAGAIGDGIRFNRKVISTKARIHSVDLRKTAADRLDFRRLTGMTTSSSARASQVARKISRECLHSTPRRRANRGGHGHPRRQGEREPNSSDIYIDDAVQESGAIPKSVYAFQDYSRSKIRPTVKGYVFQRLKVASSLEAHLLHRNSVADC